MTSKILQTYVHHGRDFHIVTRTEGEVLNQLPVGIYRLNYHEMRGWWLSEMKSFELPEKFYGDINRKAERILNTYYDRMKSGKPTGVLLEGAKGAGKTLLAKKVAVDSNLPVILINDAYTSDDFKEIISNIGSCVVIFDEFEKVYQEEEDQNAVLTLLDGVFSTRILTFIIVNDVNRLVGPLKNRPGRLFYSLDYRGLSDDFIMEYSKDRLIRFEEETDGEYERRIQSILSVAAMFKDFTFDHLQAVVEEMNRYGEMAEEVIDFLNVKIPKPSAFDIYEVRIWKDDKEITNLQSREFRNKNSIPIQNGEYLSFRSSSKSKDVDDDVWIGPKNLVDVNIKNQTFTFFSPGENVKITYRKLGEEEKYNFSMPSPF